MHELSIALSILDCLEREISDRVNGMPKGRVPSLTVRLGSICGIEPETLSFAWDVAREQGSFPEAELKIEVVPARVACEVCGGEFPLGDGEGECARCGPAGFRFVGGRGIELTRIVWEPDPAGERRAPAVGEAER